MGVPHPPNPEKTTPNGCGFDPNNILTTIGNNPQWDIANTDYTSPLPQCGPNPEFNVTQSGHLRCIAKFPCIECSQTLGN